MDYVAPPEVVRGMIEGGVKKASLPVGQLLLRGAVSGAFLGFATSLAVTAAVQTGVPLTGALVFPVGFVMIVLFGMELVTGNFALLTTAALARRVRPGAVLRNWFWVFLGNLLGSLFYGLLLAVVLSQGGTASGGPVAEKLVAVAQAKTVAYQQLGPAGMVTVLAKAVLCNWMVCMGVLMALAAKSTTGKIVAAWLPIMTFFAQGFEHSVVNMFVIPTGMLLGAEVSLAQWWLWNQVPVTLANLFAGAVFVGGVFYWSYPPQQAPAAELTAEEEDSPALAPAELAPSAPR